MKRAVCLLSLVAIVVGQDAPCCPSAKKAAATISDQIAKLESYAAKGCKTSEAKLAALCKAAGAKDASELKTKVAAYETHAPKGCEVSRKVLADLKLILAKARPALSERVAKLVASSKNGCGKSEAALAGLFKACETGCCKKLIATIKTLEASMAKGSMESAAKLAKLEAALAPRPALNARVARLLVSAKQGDAKSKKMLASLCAECCPKDCCPPENRDGCDGLVARIKTLETASAKGCETSAAKLAKVEAKLSVGKTAVPDQSCKDCTDCGDCKKK